MAKKSSDRSRLHNAIAVPESILTFIQADAESKESLFATGRKPKEANTSAVLEHYQNKLTLQRLHTNHALLLYTLWERLWLPAMEDVETLEELEHPDIWRQAALWRSHKLGSFEFMSGVLLDITKETPEVQLGLYSKKSEQLKGLPETGWNFVDKWDESITLTGLVPVSSSEENLDIRPLDKLPKAAIEYLKTLIN